MGFALLIIYLVVTFVRPGEQSPSLADWHLVEAVSGLALATAALAVVGGRGPTFRAVQIPLVLAFWAWTLLSVLASPYRSAAALDDVLGFAKGSGTAFLLLILNVDTTRRLRIVATTISVLGLFVVGQGVLAYHFGVNASEFLVYSPGSEDPASGWEDLEGGPAEPGSSMETGGAVAAGGVARIRGLGFLHDPNDLACTLVPILPLLFALRRDGASLRNTLLVWVPAGFLFYGIYLTRSRGGLLAFAGVLALAVRDRLGRTLSILAGAGAVIGLLALGFTSGRSIAMDASAAGRIDAWSEGLQMLRSSPVWGVGFGMFTEYNNLVAHNSFVHCFAELGLVGYFLWLSFIALTFDDLRSLNRAEEDSAELSRWGRTLTHSLVGFLIGAVFLSRSYDVTLFILLGLGIAVVDLARRRGSLQRTRSPLLWAPPVIALEIGSIVIVWMYMRVVR